MCETARSLLEVYGAKVGVARTEQAGWGGRFDHCYCVTTGTFDAICEEDLVALRKQVKHTPGLWVDAIVEDDRRVWASKAYARNSPKLTRKSAIDHSNNNKHGGGRPDPTTIREN
jgi:hypothetical protein